MATDASINSRPTGAFKTYPEFSKLTLADREAYEALIKDYPPIDDISFSSLMKWWNDFDASAVAILNGNLVISYWLPGLDDYSGIGLVGTNEIDKSICEIFDHQRQEGERPRLVHVPEFVLSRIQYPSLFRYEACRDYDEYVVDLDSFFPLQHGSEGFKRRVKKFIELTKGSEISVRPVDLSDDASVKLLLDCVQHWPGTGTINEVVKQSTSSMHVALSKAEALGTENVCLLVDNEIQAFILFTRPSDRHYIILSHAKLAYSIPYMYEYMVYGFAKWFVDRGVRYANLTYDLGRDNLRGPQLALGPCNYFRKYIIEPAAADITLRG